MKILVIEDEKKIREFLKSCLEAECFAVDVAEDGEEGSYMARTNEYDIIILDNFLPKKSGMEICIELRSEGNKVPIIILSVKQETVTKVDLLNAGADDYITKPFSFEELTARIRALLRRPAQIKDETITIDDLVIDTNRHTVMRGNKEIDMTRKEFMLIEYMARNKGTVLSRGMIMEHVWDMQSDPFSNTIETHILCLRRKIEKKGKKKLIHTIAGRGYKMDDMN